MNKELQRVLEQKAKSLSDLFWENSLEWNEWLRMGVTEGKQIALAPKYEAKWVSVKDAIVVFDETLAEKVSWRRRNKQ